MPPHRTRTSPGPLGLSVPGARHVQESAQQVTVHLSKRENIWDERAGTGRRCGQGVARVVDRQGKGETEPV